MYVFIIIIIVSLRELRVYKKNGVDGKGTYITEDEEGRKGVGGVARAR